MDIRVKKLIAVGKKFNGYSAKRIVIESYERRVNIILDGTRQQYRQ